MLAHVIPVVVEVLSVFLQPRPSHRIDDGQRAIVAAGYRVADVNVVEVKFLVDSLSSLIMLLSRERSDFIPRDGCRTKILVALEITRGINIAFPLLRDRAR